MMRSLVIAGAAALTCSCGQPNDGSSANQAEANQRQPKQAAYCFFDDAKMKGWAAARGKAGDITVKGRAYREDSRYKAVLGPPELSGTTATLSPTITQNDGYASPDGWWDLSATIPNSEAIDTVIVTCGGKTVAQFKLPPKA